MSSIAAAGGRVSSIPGVATAVWAALGFLCFVLLAGTVWIGYQLLQTWRLVRSLPGGILGEVGSLTRGLADVERRLSAVERQVSDLQSQVESLTSSLARARVLMGAVREVRGAVAAARSFIPSK
jgi:hypothetical protein